MYYTLGINPDLFWACKSMRYKATMEMLLDELEALEPQPTELIEGVIGAWHGPHLDLAPETQQNYRIFVQAVENFLYKMFDDSTTNPYYPHSQGQKDFYVNYINMRTLLCTDKRWTDDNPLQTVTVFSFENKVWQAQKWFRNLIIEDLIAFAQENSEDDLAEQFLRDIQKPVIELNEKFIIVIIQLLEELKQYHRIIGYSAIEVFLEQIEPYLDDLLEWLSSLDNDIRES